MSERLTGEDLALFERSVARATSSASGEALDAALAEVGWSDALAVDRRTAVSLLFELQGRAAATSSALDILLATALGADGPGVVAVVLPPLARTDPPGRRRDDGAVDVDGLATATLDRADAVLVPVAAGVVGVAAKELDLRPVAGLDPALGLVAATATGIDAPSAVADGAAAGGWSDAVALGHLALAHELIGASRTMLELARQHALERVQFDRPIAGFQAVRHRLAEALVAIEAAADATEAGWDDGTPLTAAIAKAVAGRSARVVAKHCQQVCAGIGFTLEHDLHRFLRRALVLDRLLGDSGALTRAMGEELLRTRRLPPMLPL